MKHSIFALALALMSLACERAPAVEVPVPPSDLEAANLEAAVRRWMLAFYGGDRAEYDASTVPDADAGLLFDLPKLEGEELADLQQEVAQLGLRRRAPLTLDGRSVKPTSDGGYPAGTKTVFTAGFRGQAFVIPVLMTERGWKVDVRYWVASKRKPRATLQPTDIEYTAKGFLYLILVGAPEELAQFSATGSTATTTLARTTCRTRNAIT